MHPVKELFVTVADTANTIHTRIRNDQLHDWVQFAPPMTLLALPAPLLLGFIMSVTLNHYVHIEGTPPGLTVMPILLLILAGLLGAVYRQTRVTFISLFLVAVTFSMSGEMQTSMLSQKGYATVFVALLYLSILIPSFFHANEQGLVNKHGLARLLIALSFIPCVVFLPRIEDFSEQLSTTTLLIFRPVSETLFIPVLNTLLVGTSVLVLLIRNPRESPWLGPILACSILFVMGALNAYGAFWGTIDHAIVFSIMISAAAVTLLGAIIECLRHTAHIDELTELPSRRSMTHYLSSLGQHYAIAMVDVDHFKRVNDTYGHDTGDQVLRFVSSMLAKHAPGKCFRYGGEEFAIIGAHADFKQFCKDLDQMRIHMHKDPFSVRAKDRPRKTDDGTPKRRDRAPATHTTRISVSIGVARPDKESDSVQDVIDRADKALYRAKASGRNCLRASR
jgi:diguanylate cyclase (GGDEF)-like protein